MEGRTRWFAALVIATWLPLSACAQGSTAAPPAESPATVEPIGDSGLSRLVLTEKAVERIAIQISPVTEERIGPARTAVTLKVVPYAALLYQPDGSTFVYTNPDTRTYVREAVTVDRIVGDRVLLTAGPAVGMPVVTAGGAELWGTEFKIGKY
jgi:hypothetical protein